MSNVRRKLKLLAHEDEVLRALYREFNVPTDQYPQRPGDLTKLVDSWNSLTGRQESEPDVLHYMISCRKQGKWEKLGRNAGSGFSRETVEFNEAELAALDAIHEELQVASDNFALDADLAQNLKDEFAKRTGRIVPEMILAAQMVHRRKAGALATLRPKEECQDLGFSDIEDVG